ncbi:hypothetical protein CBM2586_A110101 [Cupriavidus phytorum]|uniref:Uncharacterized protein n=1 Tax=Cupriavidus taiwanensis TaxID=164546 RepID=A0A975X694_9BURK|nr:hypothetical protein CBM2586_A110101 [Cupriavidus taiwanensis]
MPTDGGGPLEPMQAVFQARPVCRTASRFQPRALLRLFPRFLPCWTISLNAWRAWSRPCAARRA